MPTRTYLIVGAGLAGASAAAALRTEGFDGRIVLIGEEIEAPYQRPELSKTYLRGELAEPVAVRAGGFYAEAGIELVTGETARRLDPGSRTLMTDRRTYRYDRLLLATGAAPRRLTVPGSDLDGVVTLRTVRDADAIRERALAAGSIVVVGGGWIGSEVAASLRQLGREVNLIAPTRVPLEHVMGLEVGEVYAAAHRQHGVRLVMEAAVALFEGRGTVAAVVTEDGRAIPADLVVVGVGAEPRVELAADAGLAVDNGVVVDEHLQTSAPGIYAAGDVASAWHPWYERRLRVEHWDNAKRQGRTAAANMSGRGLPYDRLPYFYSDQYDLSMEYTGHAQAGDDVVFRGDPASGAFVAFWLAEGRVRAGMNVNTPDVAPGIEQLIRTGALVDRARLADPLQPLTELAAAAA